MKVVVVDDQPIFHDIVRSLIGGNVDLLVAAGSADAAREAVLLHKPTGVIIDVNVAGSNGFRLASDITHWHPSVKIVLTSAEGSSIYEQLAHTIPDAVFIEKRYLSTDALLSFFAS